MKKYHQVAQVKEGNKRIGMLIKEGNAGDMSRHIFVDMKTFEGLVKNNMVQFFVWKDGILSIEYTPEEVKFAKKYKFPLYDNLRDYFRLDLSLQMRYLKVLSERPYAYLMGSSVSGNGLILLTGMIFCKDGDTAKCLSNIGNTFMKGINPTDKLMSGLYKKMSKASDNYIVTTLPSYIWEDLGKNGWNISARGLKVALELFGKSKGRKQQKIYNRMAKDEDLELLIRKVEMLWEGGDYVNQEKLLSGN